MMLERWARGSYNVYNPYIELLSKIIETMATSYKERIEVDCARDSKIAISD
jgi:hypothetical protein